MQNILSTFKKHYTLVFVVLFAVLYIAFFAIAKESINDGTTPIDDEPRVQKEEKEEEEASVILKVEAKGSTKSYVAKLETENTVADLLEYLRSKNLIQYEIVGYTNGTRVTEINNLKNDTFFTWMLYQQKDTEVEITDVSSTTLENNGVYILKFFGQ